MAPTLTRKAGGALCLSFPFEKNFKKKKNKKPKTDIIMGVDSGLKTWVSINIVKGLKPIRQDKILSEDEFNKLFEEIDIGEHEIDRYFLDQQELTGKATDWWKYPKGSRTFF
jgi:transposase